jgi:hypothetical protein
MKRLIGRNVNKKGLSTIVTTVLLVLIVIIAIIIVWVAINPIIKKSLSSTSIDSLSTSITILQDSLVVDSDNNVSFMVRRNKGSGNVTGLYVILYDLSGNSKKVRDEVNINELETVRIFLFGSEHKVVNITKIEVLPIILNPNSGSGGTEVTGISSGIINVNHGGGGSTVTPPVISPVDGICGTTENNCISGNLASQTTNSTHYLWQCLGLNGGTNASCNSLIPPTPILSRLSVTKLGNGSGIVSSVPSGINCGATCYYDFANSTNVVLMASNGPGSNISSWQGCDAVSSDKFNCSVNLNSNKAIIVNFTLLPVATGHYAVRTFSSNHYNSGPLNVTISAYSDDYSFVIDECLPSGWTVSNINYGGHFFSSYPSCSGLPGVSWPLNQAINVSTVYSYIADAGGATGTQIFSGKMYYGASGELGITGDTSILP